MCLCKTINTSEAEPILLDLCFFCSTHTRRRPAEIFFFFNKRKPSQFIICLFLSCVVKINNRVHLYFVSRFTSVYQSGVTLRCVHSQIKSDLDFTAPGRGSSSKPLPLVRSLMSSVCPGVCPFLSTDRCGPALWAAVVSNTARYPPALLWPGKLTVHWGMQC